MSDILYDSGVLSDVDIREFWGKGIEIDTYQKGDWAFDLDKQLQLGSIDLRFRPDYKKFNLNEKDTIKYDSILQKRYTTPYDLDVDENLVQCNHNTSRRRILHLLCFHRKFHLRMRMQNVLHDVLPQISEDYLFR